MRRFNFDVKPVGSDAEPPSKKFTVTVSGTPDFIDQVRRQFAYLQYCGAVGHSCMVAISIDGDGSDRFEVQGLEATKTEEGKIKTERLMVERLVR